MGTQIFKMKNDEAGGWGIRTITVESMEDGVWLEVEDHEYFTHCITLDQEEVLMLAVALLDALKTTWPVYGELENIINTVLEDIDDGNDNSE